TGHTALRLPLGLVRGYWLPRRFGLLHQPLGGWLADRLKAMLIGGALGLAAVEVVYALLELTPFWWLVAAVVFFAAQVALTAVLPVWIVPLFYRLVPLADDGLRERLLALARRSGSPGPPIRPGSRGWRSSRWRSGWFSSRSATASRAGSSARPTTSRWPRPETPPRSSGPWSASPG